MLVLPHSIFRHFSYQEKSFSGYSKKYIQFQEESDEESGLFEPVANCSEQTANQNTNIVAEVCKVPRKRTSGLTVIFACLFFLAPSSNQFAPKILDLGATLLLTKKFTFEACLRITKTQIQHNESLGLMNNILQHGQSYSKMYGIEPRYNEPQYDELLVIMNTVQKPKRKLYPDIMNKCHHATKDERETDKSKKKSFDLVTRGQLFSQQLTSTAWHWQYRKI